MSYDSLSPFHSQAVAWSVHNEHFFLTAVNLINNNIIRL
jgi:hypothetical protein